MNITTAPEVITSSTDPLAEYDKKLYELARRTGIPFTTLDDSVGSIHRSGQAGRYIDLTTYTVVRGIVRIKREEDRTVIYFDPAGRHFANDV